MCLCNVNGIFLACLSLLSVFSHFVAASSILNKLPHQHPDPESVVQDVQWRTNQSMARRTVDSDSSSCQTGNPIDDCWRCDPNWEANRQSLADCAIGFGQRAAGGRGGQFYVVTDSSDRDPDDPTPGTLRYGAVQPQPLWIIFSGDMQIKLKQELRVSSYKTIDGRGANVHIAGGACLQIHSVTNVIVHNVNVHHCSPVKGDGDGMSIMSSANVWVDHCSLSYCADGLIDVTVGSTAVTLSNNYLSHHDKAMLLGHSDDYKADTGMQVTVAFNRFGEHLVERMPRCRRGYFHIVNNDYLQWGMYAIGGSANPTINSQGNRFIAPADANSKEVTMRMDAKESEWRRWNWRSEGDLMLNGAFFVLSGPGTAYMYAKASSLEPRSAAFIEQMTINSGVTGANGRGVVGVGNQGQGNDGGGLITGVGPGGGYVWGPIYGSGATHRPPMLSSYLALLFILVLLFVSHIS